MSRYPIQVLDDPNDLTIEERREWLKTYHYEKCRIDSILDEIEAIETQKNRLTSVLSFTPKGGGLSVSDKWLKAIERSDDCKRELMDAFEEGMKYCKEISKAIREIDHEDERAVLTMRYIKGMEFGEIAKSKKIHHVERHLYNLHNRGIVKIKVPEEVKQRFIAQRGTVREEFKVKYKRS